MKIPSSLSSNEFSLSPKFLTGYYRLGNRRKSNLMVTNNEVRDSSAVLRQIQLRYNRMLLGLISRARITAWLCIGIIVTLLYFWGNSVASTTYFGMSAETIRVISLSVMSCFVFFSIQSMVDKLGSATDDIYKEFYSELGNTHGIVRVHTQRGGDGTNAIYSEYLSRARRRVWAVGMTNRRVISKHGQTICRLLKTHDITVKIAFLDPRSSLEMHIDGGDAGIQRVQIPLLAIQSRLEGDPPSTSDDWKETISARCNEILDNFEDSESVKGKLTFALVSSVTYFSFFLIDDVIFFFPFLSSEDSSNFPIIECSALKGVGKSLLEHVERVLDNSVTFQKTEGGKIENSPVRFE